VVVQARSNDAAVANYLSRNRILLTYDQTDQEQFSGKLRNLRLLIKRGGSFESARRQAYEEAQAVHCAYPDIFNIRSLTLVYLRLFNMAGYFMQTKFWKPWFVKSHLINCRIEVRGNNSLVILKTQASFLQADQLCPE
jgi:hypothetical protein